MIIHFLKKGRKVYANALKPSKNCIPFMPNEIYSLSFSNGMKKWLDGHAKRLQFVGHISFL
jgi:hypothetical protein